MAVAEPDTARTARRGADRRAVELSGSVAVVSARRRDLGRELRPAEVFASGSSCRGGVARSDRRNVRAGIRGFRRRRRRRARRIVEAALRFDLFYGRVEIRAGRDGGGREKPDARDARAGRQEPLHRRAQREYSAGGTADHVGQVAGCGPDLRRAGLSARSSGPEGRAGPGNEACGRGSFSATIRFEVRLIRVSFRSGRPPGWPE